MKFNLDLMITNNEGALERVLSTVRQRSFVLCNILAGRSHDQTSISARITIEGSRPVETIIKQIAKLYDVKHIAISTAETSVHVYNQNDFDDAHNNALGLCASL
jgi:acetolactate synthase II small subunit